MLLDEKQRLWSIALSDYQQQHAIYPSGYRHILLGALLLSAGPFGPAHDTATDTEWQLPEVVFTQFFSPDDEHDVLETCRELKL